MSCPFQSTLDLLSRRHALTLVWELSRDKPVRFGELVKSVGTNNMTVSARLKELEAAGIVRREAFAEIPPRVEYRLTDVGRGLIPLLDSLDGWAGRHGHLAEAVVHGEAPPVAAVG